MRAGQTVDRDFDSRAPRTRSALLDHAIPFIAWLVIMIALGEPAGWKYAVRTVACAALILALKPWRWYSPPRGAHLVPSVLVGIAVFVIWVVFEGPWMNRAPALQEFYARFCMMPWGRVPDAVASPSAYAPEICGWSLTVIRILGSALVVAIAEECFWRGCLYRSLIDKDFLKVDLSQVHIGFFLLTSVFFGFEHQRWLVGIIAGMAYCGLMIRTGSIWPPIIAHAVTNLVLGIYVVATGSYAFWG